MKYFGLLIVNPDPKDLLDHSLTPMKFTRKRFGFTPCAIVLTLCIACYVANAQHIDDQWLLHPPADSWPGYHGDYSGAATATLRRLPPQMSAGLVWPGPFKPIRRRASNPHPCWLTESFTSPSPITCGPSMPAPGI